MLFHEPYRPRFNPISSLVLGIPTVLVPSPNVAENHQYFNAKSLADENAVLLIEDKDIKKLLAEQIIKIIFDTQKLEELKNNSKKLGKPDAADIIAESAIKYANAL